SELFQGLGVVRVEFRERQRVLRIRQRRYRVAVVGAQSVPQLLVDAERQYGARFMEAGVIIELRHFVQAQDHVVPRTNPFARVDSAHFEGGGDSPPGKIADAGADPRQDLAAQTWHAVTRGGVASYARALLRDPAAHLHAGVRRKQRLDVEPAAQLVPQFLP